MQLQIIIPGILVLLLLVVIFGCYFGIKWYAAPFLHEGADTLPYHETALVLGTAKLTHQGGINLYFRYRMEAAELLYKQHKISGFIVSGASRHPVSLNEGEEMKITLMAAGVPPDAVTADNYGYRTWDSLWRCRGVFGCRKVVVISQRFHTERAVFIGRKQGMEITGFNAEDVKGPVAFRMFIRECLARVKCILDLYVLHPKPVYLRKEEG
jgi:SanA protein